MAQILGGPNFQLVSIETAFQHRFLCSYSFQPFPDLQSQSIISPNRLLTRRITAGRRRLPRSLNRTFLFFLDHRLPRNPHPSFSSLFLHPSPRIPMLMRRRRKSPLEVDFLRLFVDLLECGVPFILPSDETIVSRPGVLNRQERDKVVLFGIVVVGVDAHVGRGWVDFEL